MQLFLVKKHQFIVFCNILFMKKPSDDEDIKLMKTEVHLHDSIPSTVWVLMAVLTINIYQRRKTKFWNFLVRNWYNVESARTYRTLLILLSPSLNWLNPSCRSRIGNKMVKIILAIKVTNVLWLLLSF